MWIGCNNLSQHLVQESLPNKVIGIGSRFGQNLDVDWLVGQCVFARGPGMFATGGPGQFGASRL